MFALMVYLVCAMGTGETARILGVFPSPGYSQFVLAERLMTALAKRGHEVTAICPFQPKKPLVNYKTILVDGMLEEFRCKYKK